MFWIGHKALCGVLNTPQSALWCFDYGCFIQQSEQETVRKHSGHKIYWARSFLKLMSDAEKKNTGDMAYPERFSQLQQWFTEKRAFANRLSCWSDKTRNRAIFGRLRGSFTAPKLKSVTMLLRFCFTSVISLNDLNDLRIIEARGLKYRQNIGWPEHAIRIHTTV